MCVVRCVYMCVVRCGYMCGEVWVHVMCVPSCPIFLPQALIGFCYTLIILGISRYDVHETVIRAFDVITIVVPPALPAALTVGTVYALQRLKKQQIYCISPQR